MSKCIGQVTKGERPQMDAAHPPLAVQGLVTSTNAIQYELQADLVQRKLGTTPGPLWPSRRHLWGSIRMPTQSSPSGLSHWHSARTGIPFLLADPCWALPKADRIRCGALNCQWQNNSHSACPACTNHRDWRGSKRRDSWGFDCLFELSISHGANCVTSQNLLYEDDTGSLFFQSCWPTKTFASQFCASGVHAHTCSSGRHRRVLYSSPVAHTQPERHVDCAQLLCKMWHQETPG